MNQKAENILGLGTAAMGRPLYINLRNKPAAKHQHLDDFRQNGNELLDRAYELGVRYFDTAPGYGMAEQMLIDWIRQRRPEALEIATKWGYTYAANFDPNAEVQEIKEHSLPKLEEQWATSKALLPLLAIYQIHSATLDTGVLDNNKILARLADIRDRHGLLIGITTSGHNQLDILRKALAIQVGEKDLFEVYQVTYNVFDQSLSLLVEELEDRNKKLIIKEALANGRIFPNGDYPHYASTYLYLQRLADKYAVGIDAIALRFCVDTLPIYKVLSGASTIKQLEENLKANSFKLQANEIDMLKDHAISSKDYWNERQNLLWN